jgi:uncharacterized coiled-coil DUF342 family protein
MRRNIMGTENFDERMQDQAKEREDDHGHDGDKDHDHDKCWKYKKERDEYKKERDEYKKERDEYKKERDEWKHAAWKYKKERDEYKGYLRAALERLGIAVHKLAHLLDELADGSKKICKDHGKDDDKDD